MKHKPDIEFWTFDDLYNHLKLYESDVAPASSPNVAFVSSESTSSTNYYSADSTPVNTDYYVSFPSSSETAAAYQERSESSKKSDKHDKPKSDRSYQDRIIHSFFASNQSFPDLDEDDLDQIDPDELEIMDLRWMVAMVATRIKRFTRRTEQELDFDGTEPIGFDRSKVECYNCRKRGYFARECKAPRRSIEERRRDSRNRDSRRRESYDKANEKALMVVDG